MQVFQATTGLMMGDRFRLDRRLGTTPNADTWLAHDTQHGDAPCVLKILGGADLAQVDQLHAFEREARVLGGLSHDGIPKVIDAFSDPSGAYVLALAFVPGLDLGTHLKAGPRLGEDDVFALARGLLEVLDYLHTRSPPVFHRDIKPSNIVRKPDGTPVLVDFGAVCDGWRADHTVAVGTFGYMAPEQLHGHVSPRSDLYAFGVTLLHLATGRPPSECMDLQLGVLAIPPGIELSPPITALIEACTAAAPNARPATAKAALAILDTPEEVQAPSPRPVPKGALNAARAVPTAAPEQLPPRGDLPARGLIPNAGTLPPAPREPFTDQTIEHYDRFYSVASPTSGLVLLAHVVFALFATAFIVACDPNKDSGPVPFVVVASLWLALTALISTSRRKERQNKESPVYKAFRDNDVRRARIEHIVTAGGESTGLRVALTVPGLSSAAPIQITCTAAQASSWLPGHEVPVLLTPAQIPVPILI